MLVIGVHTACEAYPNTFYSLPGLRRDFRVEEINVPLLPREGGAILSSGGALSKACKVLWAHARVIAKGLVLHPRPARVFVPYPAPLLLFAWSLMPRVLRPRRIVADAFISLYDTVVNDRGLLRATDWRAKLLWWMERRAYAVADVVIVDTPQNAGFYASLFRLPSELFVSIPLATNEIDFSPIPLPARDGTHKILFIGTLIPLHGISVIVDAARHLEGRLDIQFTIIGTGQQADILESAMKGGSTNITWERDWKTPAQLATHIASADVCIGIFGLGSKAQRVCPYKIYAYARMGRPVVTARTAWLEQAAQAFGEMPFASVNAADASDLAAEIVRLVDDDALRDLMADRARRFYDAMLANRIASSLLRTNLLGEADS
ncbi:MAG: glycosyltransferase [Herbaspirillum sp.]